MLPLTRSHVHKKEYGYGLSQLFPLSPLLRLVQKMLCMHTVLSEIFWVLHNIGPHAFASLQPYSIEQWPHFFQGLSDQEKGRDSFSEKVLGAWGHLSKAICLAFNFQRPNCQLFNSVRLSHKFSFNALSLNISLKMQTQRITELYYSNVLPVPEVVIQPVPGSQLAPGVDQHRRVRAAILGQLLLAASGLTKVILIGFKGLEARISW